MLPYGLPPQRLYLRWQRTATSEVSLPPRRCWKTPTGTRAVRRARRSPGWPCEAPKAEVVDGRRHLWDARAFAENEAAKALAALYPDTVSVSKLPPAKLIKTVMSTEKLLVYTRGPSIKLKKTTGLSKHAPLTEQFSSIALACGISSSSAADAVRGVVDDEDDRAQTSAQDEDIEKDIDVQIITSAKLEQLRVMCGELGIDSRGSKPALQQRLFEHKLATSIRTEKSRAADKMKQMEAAVAETRRLEGQAGAQEKQRLQEALAKQERAIKEERHQANLRILQLQNAAREEERKRDAALAEEKQRAKEHIDRVEAQAAQAVQAAKEKESKWQAEAAQSARAQEQARQREAEAAQAAQESQSRCQKAEAEAAEARRLARLREEKAAQAIEESQSKCRRLEAEKAEAAEARRELQEELARVKEEQAQAQGAGPSTALVPLPSIQECQARFITLLKGGNLAGLASSGRHRSRSRRRERRRSRSSSRSRSPRRARSRSRSRSRSRRRARSRSRSRSRLRSCSRDRSSSLHRRRCLAHAASRRRPSSPGLARDESEGVYAAIAARQAVAPSPAPSSRTQPSCQVLPQVLPEDSVFWIGDRLCIWAKSKIEMLSSAHEYLSKFTFVDKKLYEDGIMFPEVTQALRHRPDAAGYGIGYMRASPSALHRGIGMGSNVWVRTRAAWLALAVVLALEQGSRESGEFGDLCEQARLARDSR
eukprot:TRINITY_DN9046_c0_g4_i1.p1 TRINITY_DN9046_c0_g4~~TRINITY_DN9046_c0_g4_i1.p1  ORF type:complete len:709 (+),score=165.39 TRINITY_DN9046_c0_g4_i1:1155-3281(+)